MRKKLNVKKILVASIGVGVVSYAVACRTETSGNLVAPEDTGTDAADDVSTSGNLVAPEDTGPPDTNPDVSTSGNLMAPDASDAGDTK